MKIVSDPLFLYRLRATMALYGLTAADIARRTGLNHGYLSRVLNGKLIPKPETFKRIAIVILVDGIEDEMGEVA